MTQSLSPSQRSNFYQVLVFLVIFILIVGGLIAGQTSATPQALADKERIARVYFIEPTDGTVMPTTFTVQMGAEGLTVEPAGEIHAGAGHFHILIDVPFVEAGVAVPADDQHKHFGQAQTSTELTLAPGEHILRLQFANGVHEALDGEQYRDEITITVE